jgi:hypothetical protein
MWFPLEKSGGCSKIARRLYQFEPSPVRSYSHIATGIVKMEYLGTVVLPTARTIGLVVCLAAFGSVWQLHPAISPVKPPY